MSRSAPATIRLARSVAGEAAPKARVRVVQRAFSGSLLQKGEGLGERSRAIQDSFSLSLLFTVILKAGGRRIPDLWAAGPYRFASG
jgi:hypothetical protein